MELFGSVVDTCEVPLKKNYPLYAVGIEVKADKYCGTAVQYYLPGPKNYG